MSADSMEVFFMKKNEALLWFGSWTSKIGNIIFDYANSVSIVGAFSSAPWVLALYQSSETIIQIIFNLIGGAKADHSSRRKILILTDFISALICIALSFFVHSSYMAVVMVIANAILAFVHAFNSPAAKAIVREVIERNRIGFFNSITHTGSELIGIAGPIVGVSIVGLIGTRGALLFDAMTFLLSAISELLLTKINPSAPNKKSEKNTLTGITEGFQYLLQEKQILFLVILSSFVNFFLAGYNLLLPYTNRMFPQAPFPFYSRALAAEALGGIVGSVCCAKLINHFRDNLTALILFLACTGFALVPEPLFALSGSFYLCLLPYLLFGLSLTVFNIQFMSHVQSAVHEDYLGRVFSIIFTVAVLFMPIGSLVFSALLNPSDVRSYYVIGGGITVLALLSIFTTPSVNHPSEHF